MLLTAPQAAQATQGQTTGQWQVTDICYDSRQAKPGDIFFALIGADGHDGHLHVVDALTAGATAAVVQRSVPHVPADRLLMVEDSLKAMADLGREMRRQFKGQVIAVTGSAGKTSVKEGLRQVLHHFGRTYASVANFNNHIGVPINLCRLDLEADFAVLELGMSNPGEIRHLVQMVQPHVATINNIFPMHMENFPDLSAIARAKAEIYEYFADTTGVAIYNADAPHPDLLLRQAEAYSAARILSFGRDADVRLITCTPREGGQDVMASVCGTEVSFILQQKGEAYAYNALNILTICHALRLDVTEAAAQLQHLTALEGRGKSYTLPLPQGGEFTLIDDSYTGQPDAMILAANTLAQWPLPAGGRRLALLGQMAELGAISVTEHQRVGKTLAALPIHMVWGVGERIQDTLHQLPTSITQRYSENHESIAEALLQDTLRPGDVLLVKGAHYSSRVFEVVKKILNITGKI